MTPDSSAIKVGLIGAGAVAPLHMEALHRIGGVKVEAVAECDVELARQRASQLHIPQAYGDYQALLKDPEIIAVHCLVPNHLHYEVIQAALQAGKHVIAEKPLALTSKEARKLVAIANQVDLVTAVNFHYRYYASVQQARQMVGDGELGQVRIIRGAYLQDWLLLETDYNWRLDPKLGGKSQAVADIGSHWFDLAESVLGKRIGRVYAHTCTLVQQRKRPLIQVDGHTGFEVVRIPTEDYASILLEFEGGTVGAATLSQVSTGRKNQICFEINGSRASVRWDWENPNELWAGFRDQPNQKVIRAGDFRKGWRGGIYQLMANVYAAIKVHARGRTTAQIDYPTFEDGLRSSLIVDAVMASSTKSDWVAVESRV